MSDTFHPPTAEPPVQPHEGHFDLDAHRGLLLSRVLPAYAPLGTLAWAHAQGSLVLGYTDRSDLDVVLVWEAPEVPTGREPVVAQFDEREREFPEVIDYRDIHLDRFVIAGQEYELAHYTLARFELLMESVRRGAAGPAGRSSTPRRSPPPSVRRCSCWTHKARERGCRRRCACSRSA